MSLLVIVFASNAAVAQTITIPATAEGSNFVVMSGQVLEERVFLERWTGTQDLTLSWTFMNGTAIGGSECAADDSVDFINTLASDTATQNANILIEFPICSKNIDEPDKTFTATVMANQDAFDENASNCSSKRECTITYTILNAVPTTVTIDGSSVTLNEGETLDIPVTLSRRLVDDEGIDVPFTIININPTSDSDYQLRLKSGANLNRGVTLAGMNISFEQGAKVATLQFRAIHDEMFNEDNELVFIAFSNPVANMAFRESPSFSGSTSKGITIVNNPNALGIRIRSKIFLEGPLR